jgi:hypothetical protein
MNRFRAPISWALVFSLLVSPMAAQAQVVIQSATGEVRIGSAAAGKDQSVASGSTLTTGAKAQAVLRFEDGQRVVLHENTEFRVVDYQYRADTPAADRLVLDLLKGAARFVTGALGQRSKSAFSLRTPQATIGIRGTDFMVAVANQSYVSVTSGSVAATNSAGTATFAAGSVGTAASGSALATTIPASALPAGVSSSFSSLSSVAVSAGAAGTATAGGAGGAGASGAAIGALAPAAIAVGAAAAAAIAAGSSSSNTTGTTGTTGTR